MAESGEPEVKKPKLWTSNESIEEIRAKFENKTYDLIESPHVLTIDEVGVRIPRSKFEYWPQQPIEIDCDPNSVILSKKITAQSDRDIWFSVRRIPVSYVESHKRLNDLYINDWLQYQTSYRKENPVFTSHIPVQDFIKNEYNKTIECDMDYYLGNVAEMEKDLGQKIEPEDIKDQNKIKKIKEELIFKNMLEIFGDENIEEEKKESVVILKDCYVLYAQQGYKLATAKRGDFYYTFFGEY